MRVDRRAIAILSGCALVVAASVGLAFEPGAERICEPSADGTRFECRAKNTADVPAVRRSSDQAIDVPAKITPPKPVAPVEPAAADQPASVGNARALPNYLRSPSAIPGSEPMPAAAAPPPPVTRPVTKPAATVTTPRDEPAEMPVAATAARAPASASASAPAGMPDIDVQSREDARAFALLPSNRYTIEIARARAANELAALAVALAGVDGRIYLVRLNGADLPSYSMLWSDFATIDAARAARSTLPADVAITSGWPRRIGPLQAELVGH